jgi:dTDP-4-dehydrorhamnose 3,5-epimerase
MDIQPLKLAGTYEIVLKPRQDDRGYFMRVLDISSFAEFGLQTSWVQENESRCIHKHTVRGLHFQLPPHTETKLVRVVAGKILDVFVDLRRASPTFGQWEAVELSADNHKMAYIPRGFAHGYCSLTDESVVVYKVDAAYAPSFEGGLRWNDPTLGIQWPIREPVLSPRDATLPLFSSFSSPF